MSELYRKMIDEAMMAQHADVNTVSKKRGQSFVIDDTKAYLDVVNKMKAIENQSKAVFRLHMDSVNTHFNVLKSLTKTINRYGRVDLLVIDELGYMSLDTRGAELDVIRAADFVLHVGDQGVLHLTDTTVIDRGVLPGEVGELRVDRYADDFDTALLELVQAVIEGDQFGRADEGEVERVKEDDRVFALGFRGQRVVADFVVAHDGGCGEIGGLLAN